MVKQLRINNQIRAAQVSVIAPDGKQLGTMPLQEALVRAKEHDLDLVEVGPNVQPPITKIMDYGKYIYQKERQEKKSGGAKKQRQEQKTVRVGFKTGIHDLAFKAQQVSEFLKDGSVVKVELTLRGREKGVAHIGRQKLEQFLSTIPDEYTVQQPPQRGPYGWIVMISKKK
ncbi:MAG TPA: translation initiation factor IF-3 [Candidatus Paceibacterota bacterium]|nr:translation initiation factor IF-3 [Candidatus Paceibacterota bacterium]